MTEEPRISKNVGAIILKVAWLSILLGLGMEILILIASASFGKIPAFKVIAADLVQKVSWSSIVCMGVAIGAAVSRNRGAVMGLAGFISAPVAFDVARVLHKSATQALALATPGPSLPSPVTLAMIKAVEYAVFGYFLGIISRRSVGMGTYVFLGTGIGFIFGGFSLVLAVTQAATPIPLSGLVARAINELFFPVGCALVLFTATSIERQRISEKN